MPAFKDEHIIVSLDSRPKLHARAPSDSLAQIIAPGSQTTLAQLGLPESFTPARLRLKTRMFPSETPGQFEPYKVRRKAKRFSQTNGASAAHDSHEADFEEDPLSDEGAVWPIENGRITNWACFFALMHHVHNLMNPPFHTPILLVAQPCWTPKDHERLTQFFFEQFKTPGFAIIDAAQAAAYAHNVATATVVDVGATKADVTTILDHSADDIGRARSIEHLGGDAMTDRLQQLLQGKGFNWEMCEQLKKSAICEILPPGTPLPGTGAASANGKKAITAASATTGAAGPGKDQRNTLGSQAAVPRGPGQGTEVGNEATGELPQEDNDGVLDVASIVTSGKMNDYLERKEKEKQEKNAAKKKGGAADASKPARLKNSDKEKNTFYYEDHSLLAALKGSNMDSVTLAEKTVAMDEGPKRVQPPAHADGAHLPTQPAPISTDGIAPESSTVQGEDAATSPNVTSPTTTSNPLAPRRELTVGTERFQPHSPDFLLHLTDVIHRTIQASPIPARRQELWDSLIIVGNGSKVRGFKEALLHTLSSRFLISPSSATMLSGDIPSTFSTPGATGTTTPIPSGMPLGQMQLPGAPSGVNPLLYAATTANYPGPPSSQGLMTPSHLPPISVGPSQTPTRIKTLELPSYFPEWKDHGVEEAPFLGAQVAAKVVFVADVQGGSGKGWMSRSDYNESGPGGIGEFLLS